MVNEFLLYKYLESSDNSQKFKKITKGDQKKITKKASNRY